MIVRWRFWPLRAPTAREVSGGVAVAALVLAAYCHGRNTAPTEVQEVRVVEYDTVTVEHIRQQEPPADPGLIHRATYRDVAPTRVEVAPGAGRELLAAVCDTSRAQTRAESQVAATGVMGDGELTGPPSAPNSPPAGIPRVIQGVNTGGEHPALAYAGTLSQPWHPWGKQTLKLFSVSRDGETVTETRIHAPAEWRSTPVPVVREARGWRRLLKPVPFTLGIFAAGWVAHGIATQF